jgi:hypothetical protein
MPGCSSRACNTRRSRRSNGCSSSALHWGVENTLHTLGTAFAEDDRPWIEADPQGMLAMLLLRRIAYTLLALYRAVTLRSDEGRAARWKHLLASVGTPS